MTRPVAVLDACVLIPPGLRDLLLSVAHEKGFRPVWQADIEAETHRNTMKVTRKRDPGLSPEEARHAADHVLEQMNAAFPDARLDDQHWRPLVATMTNNPKDRHVMAAAVGAKATHVVTTNIKDFPVASRRGVTVEPADSFLLGLLATSSIEVLAGVDALVVRNKRPPTTHREIVDRLKAGKLAPRFGAELENIRWP